VQIRGDEIGLGRGRAESPQRCLRQLGPRGTDAFLLRIDERARVVDARLPSQRAVEGEQHLVAAFPDADAPGAQLRLDRRRAFENRRRSEPVPKDHHPLLPFPAGRFQCVAIVLEFPHD